MEEELKFTYGIFDYNVYQKLLNKSAEELTEEEHEYCIFCYHYEEWRAGLL